MTICVTNGNVSFFYVHRQAHNIRDIERKKHDIFTFTKIFEYQFKLGQIIREIIYKASIEEGFLRLFYFICLFFYVSENVHH